MKMDEHARAWAHEFVGGMLTRAGTPADQRASFHWEILSHLHEAAERRVARQGGSVVTVTDLQAVVAELGGETGLTEAFLQVRFAATPRAGFGKRVGAFLIDVLVVACALWVMTGVFFWMPFWFTDAFLATPVPMFVLLYGYFVFMEWQYGATLGKMAFKLRAVMADGRPLEPQAAFLRNIAKAIPPLLLVDVLFYLIAFQRDDQRASDRIADTIVIDTKQTAWTSAAPASNAPPPAPAAPPPEGPQEPPMRFVPVDSKPSTETSNTGRF